MADKPKPETPANEKSNKKTVLKSCFIVTPIGEPNSEVNQKAFGLINAVMKPVLADFDYQPIAASDISSPGSINKQIIIRLYEDELVIANLTGLNPNVMYELAVRHAVKKPVIIMAEKGTKLPFDLVDQRCIFYEDNLNGVQLAKELLQKFLSTTLEETEINNPIYDSIKESQIIKQVTSSDDPNQYILSRFDRLERFIMNLQKDELKVSSYAKFVNQTFRSGRKPGDIVVNVGEKKISDVIDRIFSEFQMIFPDRYLHLSTLDSKTFLIKIGELTLDAVAYIYTLLEASNVEFRNN